MLFLLKSGHIFGPEEQYISGVCTYWLLKKSNVLSLQSWAFLSFSSGCLRDELCGLLVNLENQEEGGVFTHFLLQRKTLRGSLSTLISVKTMANIPNTHRPAHIGTVWARGPRLTCRGGDRGLLACRSRREVHWNDWGWSFLRILNAEPVPRSSPVPTTVSRLPLLHRRFGSFFL